LVLEAAARVGHSCVRPGAPPPGRRLVSVRGGRPRRGRSRSWGWMSGLLTSLSRVFWTYLAQAPGTLTGW